MSGWVGKQRPRAFDVQRLLSESLHLVILPTEQCNFRCTYCYETFELGRMGAETLAATTRFLDRVAPSLRRLSIEWFGGEPLVAFREIEHLQRHVGALQQRLPQLTFSGAMTTNGYLLDSARLKSLVGWNVRSFQVSIDGEAEAHDARRPLANGRETWRRIYDNLLAAKASHLGFDITIRVHVDRENLESMPAFLSVLARDFAGDDRFRVFLRPVSRLGGPQDDQIPVLRHGATERVTDLVLLAEQLGLGLPSKRDDMPCYAAMPNSLVIRSDGRLCKCTVALEDPRNQVGRLLPDGSITLEPERWRPWSRGLSSGKVDELTCPWATMRAKAQTLPVIQ